MKIEDEYIIFEDETKHYAPSGIIGLDENLDVTTADEDCIENITPAQKHELADYMIELWHDYKASI